MSIHKNLEAIVIVTKSLYLHSLRPHIITCLGEESMFCSFPTFSFRPQIVTWSSLSGLGKRTVTLKRFSSWRTDLPLAERLSPSQNIHLLYHAPTLHSCIHITFTWLHCVSRPVYTWAEFRPVWNWFGWMCIEWELNSHWLRPHYNFTAKRFAL